MANYYWAKTTEAGEAGCSVSAHGQAAGEVCRLLMGLFTAGVRGLLPEGIVTLASVHDVGKITPGFQTKCSMWQGPDGLASEKELRNWRSYPSSHAAVSQHMLQQYYRQCRNGKKERYWSACVGAHHGKPCAELPDKSSRDMAMKWWEDGQGLIQEMEKRFGPLPAELSREERQRKEALQDLITGLIIVSDWIASHEHCFSPQRPEENYADRAQEALKKIGFLQEVLPKPGRSWQELFPRCPEPRSIQQHMWEAEPQAGIYVIEDAMGGGKTEAALGLAYRLMEAGRANGLYFALPTQATSNRIFFRVRDFLSQAGACANEQSLQLVHGNSWLMREHLFDGLQDPARVNPRRADYELTRWFSSAKRALLSRYGVGTIDQALMGELSVKHSYVRSYALSGKVVILDEVHSYDVYTGRLVQKLAQHLSECGATVIILSATLTQNHLRALLQLTEGEFPAYPQVVSRTGAGLSVTGFQSPEQPERKVLAQEYTDEELLEMALTRAEQGQCVLWIRNTVKEAQATCRLLMAERCEGGPEIGLLHARFPYWRREELEGSWISRLGKDAANRPRGCVLVSTQVVEQSIDIDADCLITDLAPTDMLLQRTGRLWRHERPLSERCCETPEMIIAIPRGVQEAVARDNPRELKNALGSSGHVYAPYVLWRSWQLWNNRQELRLPSHIRELIEATYQERTEDSRTGKELLAELQQKMQEMERSAELNSTRTAGTMDDTEGIMTRYGNTKTVDILLLRREPQVTGPGERFYEPLHGEGFRIQEGMWNYAAAKSIATNVVRVPEHLVGKREPNQELECYSVNKIFPVIVLDSTGHLLYNDTELNLRWNPDTGIEQTQPLSYNEEESEFMY